MLIIDGMLMCLKLPTVACAHNLYTNRILLSSYKGLQALLATSFGLADKILRDYTGAA